MLGKPSFCSQAHTDILKRPPQLSLALPIFIFLLPYLQVKFGETDKRLKVTGVLWGSQSNYGVNQIQKGSLAWLGP